MKILVVDDDRALREVMSKTVARWGYETDTAEDGVKALAALRGPNPAQIILLDLMMPNMDGVETCRHITCTIPGFVYIIILTAVSSRDNFVKALEAGAHDFLAKPVNMTELKCRLEVGRRLAQAEEQTRRNHIFLEAAAQGSGLGMWEVDVPARMIRINRRLRELIGLKDETITIADWLDLVHDEDYEVVKNQLEQSSGLGEDTEYRVRTANGQWRWILVRGKAISQDENGKPLQFCGSIQDVTTRVENENRMFEAERLAAVHTLAAGVAHNFNNINTGVSGNLELILRDKDISPQIRQWAQRALDSSHRISDVTASLQRLSSQREPSAALRYSFKQIIEDALLFMQGDFAEDKIELSLDIDQAPEVNGDSGALAQAVFILLDNARHALGNTPKKKLRIRCFSNEGKAVLRVTDNGCGIRHEDMRKLFSPFFSTKGEHAPRNSYMGHFRGMGLGLFTMSNIIRWHNGEVQVESSVGEGTSFTVTLPLPQQSPLAG